jgi:hypothetical protein
MNKTYYLTTKWKIIYFSLSAIYHVVVIGISSYFVQLFAIAYIVMGLISLIFSVYGLNKVRIILNPQGIEYHVPFVFVYEVTWGVIQEIGFYGFRECLFIDKNLVKVNYSKGEIYATYMGFGDFAFIPLNAFSNSWRNSELGQQIQQYAPNLFEKEKSEQIREIGG